MKDRTKEEEFPVLEEPEGPDSPGAGSDLLLDSTVSVISAKLAFLEAALKILVRNENFNDFLRDTLLAMMKVVPCEAGSILEIDHTHKQIFFRTAAGYSSDKVVKFVIPLGKGIVGHVAESKQPLIVDDVAHNKVHLEAIQKAVGFDARNMLAAPIIIRGNVYGVVELLNRSATAGFSSADVEMIMYCCEMAAKTIEMRMMLAWSATRRAA